MVFKIELAIHLSKD